MRLRVLGCHGGESPSHRTTCFVVNDDLLLDAGAVTRGLPPADQSRIDYVFLSHSHLDHVYGLALLCDNVIAERSRPIEVLCGAKTAETLTSHLFNGALWPDFSRLPTPEAPTLRFHELGAGERLEVGQYRLLPLQVDHTVDCLGVIVTSKAGSVAYSGDTGPTERFWQELNSLADLRAVICEVSFPNRLADLARTTGHLTPALLAHELTKFRPKTHAPVMLTHLKPAMANEVKEELAALADSRLVVLKPMDEFEF
jgi:ribonuclease BN (tRNA processing enzyme)